MVGMGDRDQLAGALRDGAALHPESAAPRMKSIWPPTPLYMRDPIELAQTWPVRSISIAELIATVLLKNERITRGVAGVIGRAHLDHRVAHATFRAASASVTRPRT